MIRRLLLTAATSALLVVCTIIALEALGLLFQRGTPEPVINSVVTPDIPEESAVTLRWKQQDQLALARLQAEQERLHDAGQLEAARQAEAEAHNLADAANLPNELPQGQRTQLNPEGPPYLLWANVLLFLLVLSLLTAEWLLRKQWNLL